MSALYRKISLMAAKVEAVPGTAETLTVAEAVDMISNLQFEFLTTKTKFERPGSMGKAPGIYGVRTARIRFRLGLSAATITPRCASVYLVGCGFGNTSGGVFARVQSGIPTVAATTAGPKSLTMQFMLAGTNRLMYGCVGNAVIHCLAGEPTWVDFDFKGKYLVGVADLAILAPTLANPTLLRFANAGFLLGTGPGYAPRMSKIDLDLGNKVELLEDENAADGSGIAFGYVDDFDTIGAFDPEQSLVATNDFYSQWEAGTEQAVAWSCKAGTASAAFAMTKAEFVNLRDGTRRGLAVWDSGFQDNAADLSITFATA